MVLLKEVIAKSIFARNSGFTFQYGSIKRISMEQRKKEMDKNLHSSMVLLKDETLIIDTTDIAIYIPVWFY